MERVDRIWKHPHYQRCLAKIQELEKEREFCRHTPEHFLDVARLTYIFALERGMSVDKSVIYGAALLHDIGRFRQYEDGTPHDVASVEIAKKLLPECGYSPAETEQIVEMIASHRCKSQKEDLNGLFYKADKMSRSCYSCPAESECNWAREKKNLQIRY